MADAQHMHALKWQRVREAIPGKIARSKTIGLERRVRFARINGANFGDRLGGLQRRSNSDAEKIKLFFDMFQQLPSWFTNLWILVVASIYGIKGTQIFKNGGKK